MTEFKTTRYIDQLQAIIDGLNNRFLPVIDTTPASVNIQNELSVFHKRYDQIFRHKLDPPKFRKGDHCRLHLQKKDIFEKAYTANFSKEIYVISAIRTTRPVHIYELSDLNGDRIKGRWDQQSLVPVCENGDAIE